VRPFRITQPSSPPNGSIGRIALVLLVLAPIFVAATAFADDKAACLDAASRSQRLRAAHLLVEARDQLLICATAKCPAVVRGDCADWLAQVELALPSVVVTAKSSLGSDLVDVQVTVDGKAFLSKLDGIAVRMNAGQHTFHFETPDGATLDRLVIVPEGKQSQPVAVVLGRRATPDIPAVAAVPIASLGTDASTGASRPLRTLGWVIGAVGAAGLAVGGAFGVTAIVDTHDAHCNASMQCAAGPLGRARTAADVSDAGLIAGGVLTATAVTLMLVGPSARSEGRPATTLGIAPALGRDGAGVALAGSF
jgi:hypothetical protein